MNRALAGASIVVTRPAGQADALCAAIRAAGGLAHHIPLLSIEASEPDATARAALARGGACDLVIFTSPNAVSYAQAYVDPAALPATTGVAAIGPGTARALKDAGREEVILPLEGASSEALLEHPALQDLSGRQVLLIKGVGGRPVLADTLRERGARVIEAAVYQRRAADSSAALGAILATGEIDAIIVTSAEALAHMSELAGTRRIAALRSAQLVVPSERVVKQAAALGFRTAPIVAADASDAALLRALGRWWKTAELDEDEA